MNFSIKGLVLRDTDRNDNDKLLTVLTSERGRITVMAKGAHSIKSRALSGTQLFTYSDMELYEKGGFYWLREATVIDAFMGIAKSVEKMSVAAYIADLAYEFSGEDEAAEDILKLTLNAFYALARDIRPLLQVKGAYELCAAGLSGYMPDVSGCKKCKKPNAEFMYFDVMNGRFLCADCMSEASLAAKREAAKSEDIREAQVICPMSPSVTAAVRYVFTAPIPRFLSFTLAEEEIPQFASVSETYVLSHIGHGFESLDFYKMLFS